MLGFVISTQATKLALRLTQISLSVSKLDHAD